MPGSRICQGSRSDPVQVCVGHFLREQHTVSSGNNLTTLWGCSQEGQSRLTPPLPVIVSEVVYFLVWTTMLPPPIAWSMPLS